MVLGGFGELGVCGNGDGVVVGLHPDFDSDNVPGGVCGVGRCVEDVLPDDGDGADPGFD